jgi:hypothetical protein
MKILLRRLRLRWEDNIKTDSKEIGCMGVDWIHLAKGRVQRQALMDMIMELRVP